MFLFTLHQEGGFKMQSAESVHPNPLQQASSPLTLKSQIEDFEQFWRRHKEQCYELQHLAILMKSQKALSLSCGLYIDLRILRSETHWFFVNILSVKRIKRSRVCLSVSLFGTMSSLGSLLCDYLQIGSGLCFVCLSPENAKGQALWQSVAGL